MHKIKVLCYNIATCKDVGRGYWEYLMLWKHVFANNSIIPEIGKFINKLQPDVVGITEIDEGSLRSHGANQAKLLAEEIGYNCCYHAPHRRGNIQSTGNAFLTKHKVLDFKPVVLPNPEFIEKLPKIPFIFPFYKRGIIETYVKISNKKIRCMVTHLDAFAETVRKRQLGLLVKRIESKKVPTILMGDFNAGYGSDVVETIKRAGLTDVGEQMDSKKLPTFPTWQPFICFDHVFVSKEFKINKFRVLDARFSDHRPIYAELSLK